MVDADMVKRLSAVFDYDALAEDERAAPCRAMMRMHDGFMAQARSSCPDFRQTSGFIPAQMRHPMEKALFELMAAMEERGFEDARQCLDALVLEDFFSD